MDEETATTEESTRLLRDISSGFGPENNGHYPLSAEQRSSSGSSESMIDEEELQYDLARVSSHPTGLGMEPTPPETMPPRTRSYGTVGPRRSTSHHTVRPRHPDGHPAIDGAATTKSDVEALNLSRGRFWLVFGGILFAYFVCFSADFIAKLMPFKVACFDSTLMASSHPVITSYFNSSNSASWLSTVFLLTSTAFQPLFGRISDTIGRRPLYLFALTTFSLATAWCATAESIGSFIAARAVCGLGAGGTMAMGMIITSDLVPIENRGIYQSYINLFFGMGSIAGAALGGFLCDRLGWRWTFGIQVPYILLCLLTTG